MGLYPLRREGNGVIRAGRDAFTTPDTQIPAIDQVRPAGDTLRIVTPPT